MFSSLTLMFFLKSPGFILSSHFTVKLSGLISTDKQEVNQIIRVKIVKAETSEILTLRLAKRAKRQECHFLQESRPLLCFEKTDYQLYKLTVPGNRNFLVHLMRSLTHWWNLVPGNGFVKLMENRSRKIYKCQSNLKSKPFLHRHIK